MRLFSHPILANYYLTYRCNAQCSFCDIWEKPSPYVTLENLQTNLRDLKRLGVRVIDFTGGEPLLHRQLPQFLALAKQQGFITTLTTNTLLYPKQAQALHGLVDMLHFSLDYPDRARHNASRGVDCYDHLLRSIGIAKTLGERPDILYTVTEDSIADIAEAYAHITQPNGLILILNPIFAYNAVGTDLPTQHFATLRQWARKPGIYLNEGFLQLREAGGNDIQKPVCYAASSSVVIAPDNALVLPCYHLGLQQLPIHDNLYELWHSPAVQQWVGREGRLPACQGCSINCYMQPSFAYKLNKYFVHALPSTLKYSWEKWGLRLPAMLLR